MRCGCTSSTVQCPACPENVYVDDLDIVDPLVLPVGTLAAPTEVDLVTRVINIPAMVPGFGLSAVAEYAAVSGGDQQDIEVVAWTLRIDGTQFGTARFFNLVEPSERHSNSIIGGIETLTPGVHKIAFHLTLASVAGNQIYTINGAGMRTDLIRNPGITVTP